MIRTLLAVVATTTLLAACGDDGAEANRTEGPIVSGPGSPGNDAIDTTPATEEMGQASGASSFTEGQARGAIERAGYTQVGELTQNEDGLWQGTATKDGAESQVSIDYRGAVTAQ